MKEQNIWLRVIAVLFLRSRIALAGASIAAATAIGGVTLVPLGSLFGVDSPYIGILDFLVFPAVFFIGLLLIPVGNAWANHRNRKRHIPAPYYPKLDFGVPRVRREFGIVAFLTAANLFIISAATFRGAAYMETEQFCGQVCHTVMEPEFTAHANSPHARVACVDCHIGPGAESFVKAKFNGVNQLFATVFNSYEKPIPAPVRNLRHAQEICTECHDPAQYVGDQVRMFTEYGDDESNTPVYSAVVLNVGGGTGSGIHSWHNDPKKRVLFYAADEQRQDIQYVRVEHDDGRVIEYVEDGVDLPSAARHIDALREMDCTDCHNRPAHTFELPQRALDAALTRGNIDPTIPFIKNVGHEALRSNEQDGGSADDVATILRAYYAENHTEFADANAPLIDQAVREIRSIYARNVFPKMNIGWGTYPDNSGHTQFEGCFRCHDESHLNAADEAISQDCSMCHEVLAFREGFPDVLTQLNPLK